MKTRREQQAREALRARREAMRARLRTRLGQRKGRPEPRKRRRWWLLLLLLLLLLWLLLPDCDGEDPLPVVVPDPPTATGTGIAPTAPPEPEPPAVARRDRPAFEVRAPEALPWIASFRMQVAARSTRLATCFVGADRPGRLRWAAAVEPGTGRVSDHALEPTLQSEALSAEQRACVIGVLSDPPYRIEASDGRSTPSRVGMVIEF